MTWRSGKSVELGQEKQFRRNIECCCNIVASDVVEGGALIARVLFSVIYSVES